MSAQVLILQHVPWEEPALIAQVLQHQGFEIVTRNLLQEATNGNSTSDLHLEDYSGIVIMGGPMGANDEDHYPGLAREKELIARALERKTPILGVCLGMQLLAVVLGATLKTAATREIGFSPVSLTRQGLQDEFCYPLMVDFTADPTVLHWHCDTVSLPAGAQCLASSSETEVQAFRYENSIGLQFHLEVDKQTLRNWLQTPEMIADLTAAQVQQIASDGDKHLSILIPRALIAIETFAKSLKR